MVSSVLEVLRARVWVSIASRHSSIHHGTGTWHGSVDDQEMDYSKVTDTAQVNLSIMKFTVRKEVFLTLTSCDNREQLACFTGQFGMHYFWRTFDCTHWENKKRSLPQGSSSNCHVKCTKIERLHMARSRHERLPEARDVCDLTCFQNKVKSSYQCFYHSFTFVYTTTEVVTCTEVSQQ
jgi:hypothetical protein